MSSSEAPTATTIEPVAQPVAPVEDAPIAPSDQAAEVPVATEAPAVEQHAVETPVQEVVESTPVAEDVKVEDDKKEKKPTRKPFADLLSKILKPHPHEKPALEKKEVNDVPAPTTEEAVPAPALETLTENTEAAVEAPGEVPSADEAPKEASSPRKERGNIFEKLTALVMKPKSPKPKKTDVTKEESDETPAVEAIAEPLPTVEPIPASPAAEVVETLPAEVPAAAEVVEEPKSDKKEKTPKDLAKLARRFSGRLFGVEKKKDTAKRPEPTPEEAEEAAKSEAPAADVAVSATAPQIPAEVPSADSSSETPQATTDSAPVIAAAA